MSKNINESTSKSVYIYFGLAIVGILIIGLFRDSIFIRGDVGQIIITELAEGSTVYVDKVESRTVNSTEENLKLGKFNVGVHSILIIRSGFWPWLKEVEIKKGEKIYLSPFFAPENGSGFFINDSDPEYQSIIEGFDTLVVPGFDNRRISKDGNVAFWIDDNTIFAEWLGSDEEIPEAFCNESDCPRVTIPLTVGGAIRNADFYKGRSDVIVVSFGNGVFAIEIDNKNHQNFQPIYEGNSPQFLLENENAIYVLDEGILREVRL